MVAMANLPFDALSAHLYPSHVSLKSIFSSNRLTDTRKRSAARGDDGPATEEFTVVGENPHPKFFSFIFLVGLLLPFCLPSPLGPIPRWAPSTLPILTGVSFVEAEKAIYAVVVSQLRD